jgi:hypothetical protein
MSRLILKNIQSEIKANNICTPLEAVITALPNNDPGAGAYNFADTRFSVVWVKLLI